MGPWGWLEVTCLVTGSLELGVADEYRVRYGH
jgi:hypothetical protein